MTYYIMWSSIVGGLAVPGALRSSNACKTGGFWPPLFWFPTVPCARRRRLTLF